MEASEKPQLPLQPDAHGDGSVRLVEDRIVIERMEIADRGTARVVREQFKEGREPVETVTRAIEIGARVIESEGTAANVDFVNSQFERHVGGLAEQLSELLQAGNDELAQQLATNFGADQTGSVQAQIRDMLVKANEHQRTEMVRLFNAEEGANPLSDFKTSVTAKVAEAAQRAERQSEALRESHSRESKELREQVALLKTEVARLTERREGDELLAEAEEAGTRKGRSFEERVHSALEAIAAPRGDVAHAVGDAANETGSKKGDTLVEVGAAAGTPAARIVFESKNRRLDRPKAWRELNASMEDRDSAYAVLVVAGEENVPAKTQTLLEYEGNKLIVAVDPEEPETVVLETAYCLARARVLAAGESELAVDAPGVRAAADEALMALRERQTITKSLTGARKNVERAQEVLDEMTDRVKDRLERVDDLVSAAADEAEEA
jgi:hypothetical protein